MVGRIEGVLAALEAAGVRYLVVGGVAVVLHGHLRTTADLDLLIDLDGESAARAVRALAAAGFRPRAPVAIEEKNLEVFSLWHPEMPGFEVYLFVTRPLEFADAWARRVEVDTGRARIAVVALEDLVEMKRRAGRPRDLEDLAALRAIESSRDRTRRGAGREGGDADGR